MPETDPADDAALWNIEAARHARELKQPLSVGRDITIYRWLEKGDVRALAAMLLQGHKPAPLILNYLGKMLLEWNDVKFTIPSKGDVPVPYRLIAKKRSGTKGRRGDPENDIRDILNAESVARLSKDGGYDAAIWHMFNVSRKTGAKIGRETIRKAYDSLYGKKSRK